MISYHQQCLHNAGLTLSSRWGRWPAEESVCQRQTALHLVFLKWMNKLCLRSSLLQRSLLGHREFTCFQGDGSLAHLCAVGHACFPTVGNIFWGQDPASRETRDSSAIISFMGRILSWRYGWSTEHDKHQMSQSTCPLKGVSKAVVHHKACRDRVLSWCRYFTRQFTKADKRSQNTNHVSQGAWLSCCLLLIVKWVLNQLQHLIKDSFLGKEITASPIATTVSVPNTLHSCFLNITLSIILGWTVLKKIKYFCYNIL